jgi:2-oxoglutarate dehydrogenase complex dehydrogenase (E1) component-like enzyme
MGLQWASVRRHKEANVAKATKTSLEIVKPNVAAALEAIRSKKSREQVKIERLLPFVPVIEEALKSNWKWSPIVTLIRENNGPSLSKQEAENLYEQIKSQYVQGNDSGVPAQDMPAEESSTVSLADVFKREAA